MSGQRVSVERLRSFITEALEAAGVDPIQVQSMADILIWGELIGRPPFGVSRLPTYIQRVKEGGIKCPCEPTFREVSGSMQHLDGGAGFGQYVGKIGMQRAIELARDHGVGIVGVRNSNFCGATGYFTFMAAEAGMIGIALSNSTPKVAAPDGLKRILGTNPFAFGAPRREGNHLMIDMATSALSGSGIRSFIERGESLPPGVAIDCNGEPTTDPDKVNEGAMLSAGGAKGFGLALIVEVLSGLLTGAGVSKDVASMYNATSEPGNNGHFLLALDVSRWLPMEEYYDRFEGLVNTIRGSSEEGKVRLPGEVRWEHYRRNLAEGIFLDDETCHTMMEISERQGINSPLKSRGEIL